MTAIIAYYRVSTKRQGDSGLGLEGQRTAAQAYARHVGGTIRAEYTEIESGKRNDRPELTKALAHARRAKATLVVAKLDRLARNVAFLANIIDSKVDFIACDNPQANTLVLHILSAVAEAELKAISERTKAALVAYKARGGKLGAARPECRNLTQAARVAGAHRAGKVHAALAQEAYVDLLPTMAMHRDNGLSLRGIAAKLNEDGQMTRRGKPWNQTQVARVLARA